MRSLFVGVSLFFLGCQSAQPEPTELAQGATILETSDTALSAAFRKEDVVIYMQAVRGGPTAANFQGVPNAPQFEIDVRFIADNGRIFYSRRGGDAFVDPTWADDLEAQGDLPPSRESNRILFDMADEAAGVLAEDTTLLGERANVLAPELDAIVSIGRQAPGTYAMMVDERIKHGLAVTEIPYGKSNGPEAPDAELPAGYYYLALHADDLDGSPWGYHSATRLYRWDGYWAFANDFCNHGRCPYEGGGMPQVGFVQAGDGYKPAWRMNACNTGYGLYSDDGGHNCHDDSRLQMASYMFGNGHQKDPGNSYWCNGKDDESDISVNIWGWELDNSGYPQTTTNAKKGYTHAHMCRNQNIHGYNSKAACYCDQACLTNNDCCIDGPY